MLTCSFMLLVYILIRPSHQHYSFFHVLKQQYRRPSYRHCSSDLINIQESEKSNFHICVSVFWVICGTVKLLQLFIIKINTPFTNVMSKRIDLYYYFALWQKIILISYLLNINIYLLTSELFNQIFTLCITVSILIKCKDLFQLMECSCVFQAPRGADLRQWALRVPCGNLWPGNEGEGCPGFRKCFSYCYVWVPSTALYIHFKDIPSISLLTVLSVFLCRIWCWCGTWGEQKRTVQSQWVG